jgi:hypothetical protein
LTTLAASAKLAPVANSGPHTVKLRPGRNGGQLRSGNPGNKGGGLHSEAFKERVRRLAEEDALWQEARKKNPNHVLGLVASYHEGIPKQQTQLSGEVKIVVRYDDS